MELDSDGGASHGAGGGATVVTVVTDTVATGFTGATVALGGGAVIDLHPVKAVIHIKCCECECCRFTSC